MLNNLSQYFKKFTGIVPREKIIKEKCIETCQRVTGIALTKDMIRIQHACIWLRIPSVIRAEIERKKEILLQMINEDLGQEKIQKIQYM